MLRLNQELKAVREELLTEKQRCKEFESQASQSKSEYQNLEIQMKALEDNQNAQLEKHEKDKAKLKKAYDEV